MTRSGGSLAASTGLLQSPTATQLDPYIERVAVGTELRVPATAQMIDNCGKRPEDLSAQCTKQVDAAAT